jgi:excisionase family DNA binding protein
MEHPVQPGGDPLDVMTVAEVASLLRVSKMTVYRLVQAGEIASLRVGHSFRLPRTDVVQYLRTSQFGGKEDPGHDDARGVRRLTEAAGGFPDAAGPVRAGGQTPTLGQRKD